MRRKPAPNTDPTEGVLPTPFGQMIIRLANARVTVSNPRRDPGEIVPFVLIHRVEYSHAALRLDVGPDGKLRPEPDRYGSPYHAVSLSRADNHSDGSRAARSTFVDVIVPLAQAWIDAHPEAVEYAARADFERRVAALEEKIAAHEAEITTSRAELNALHTAEVRRRGLDHAS